uniref:uncharacterized protein alms1 isoform X2 n=1 Tax=Pristiophorus japonicus TaxID=55135 RepID=UPI00398F70B0
MERAESAAIATTPPLTRGLEEQASQTSSPGSGTQLSNASGFSLGEVIVQRAKQGGESWPQLQAEADIGEVSSASVSRLLLASAERERTLEEFPTMEEGMISVTEESMSEQRDFRLHQLRPMLELQQSGLSPALPLFASRSTQDKEGADLSNTFFYRSPLEFVPLRGTLDLSGYLGAFRASSSPRAIHTEVSADCARGSLSLSQHPLEEASSACSLSQHSLTPPSPGSEATGDEDFARAETYIRDQHFMELPSAFPSVRGKRGAPEHEAPPGRELPASLLLDLPEQEMGLPNRSGSGSSTESDRPPSPNRESSSPGAGVVAQGNAALDEQGLPSVADQPVPGRALAPPQRADAAALENPVRSAWPDPGTAFPKPVESGNLSRADSGLPETSDTVLPSWRDASRESGPEASSNCRAPPPSGFPAASSSALTAGAGAVTPSTEPAASYSGKDSIVIQVPDSTGDGTGLSGDSTQRDYQDNELSLIACPLGLAESPFLTSLPDPLCQSTPAVPLTVPSKVLVPLGRGRRVADTQVPALAKFPLAPSFTMWASSSASQDPSFSSSSYSTSSPGALQSLPPLSYMEKVGAWSLQRCPGGRPSFDSLVLHGLKGVSPRQRAYSAIADSLNHILAQAAGAPASSPPPRRSIAASFGAAAPPSDSQASVQQPSDPPPSVHQPSDPAPSDSQASVHQPSDPQASVQQPSDPPPSDPQASVHQPSDPPPSDPQASVHQPSDPPPSVHQPSDPQASVHQPSDPPPSVHQPSDPAPSDPLPSTRSCSQSTIQQPDPSAGRPLTPASPAGPRGGSQPGARRESSDDALLCRPDSPRHCPRDDRGCPLDPASALGESLLSGPLPPDHPLEPNPTDQSARPPERRAASPNSHISTATVCADQFDDASPLDDDLKPPGSSQDTSRAGEQTLTVSGHSLTSLEVDNYDPAWAPTQFTPDANRFNIEDRIPIYLRNLGITQSPTSILGSKGSSRQLELSPFELKKLRDAVGSTTKGFQGMEGVSPLDRVSRCSFYSDTLTHSTSIPMGSDTGRDTPAPSELSPGTAERVPTDPAISQCSSGYTPAKRRLDICSQRSPRALPLPDSESAGEPSPSPPLPGAASSRDSMPVSRRVRQLLSRFEGGPDSTLCDPVPFPDAGGSEGTPAAPPRAGARRVGDTAEAVPSNSGGGRLQYPRRDDGTLRPDDSFIGSKTLSEIRQLLGEAGTLPAALLGSLPADSLLEGPDSDSAATPGSEGESRFLSRRADESSRTVTATPTAGSPGAARRTPLAVGIAGGTPRSPPEEAGRRQPLEGRARPASGGRSTRLASAGHAGRAEPEGCSARTAGSGAGAAQSVHPPRTPPTPPLHAPPRRAHTQRGDSGSGGGLEEGSSTDSLAARVATLLGDQCPAELASNLISAAGEVEHGEPDWKQIKPMTQPLDPLSILDEEDRRKIEEIKAELLQTSKNLVSPQDGWSVDAEDFSLSSDLASPVDTCSEMEWPALPSTTFLSLDAARSQISGQLQKLSNNLFDTSVPLRTPLRRDMDERLKAMALGSPAGDWARSPSPSQPALTITVSSCRRPPSSSPRLGDPLLALLPEAAPGGVRGPGDHEVSPGSACPEETGVGPAGLELAQRPSPALRQECRRSGPEPVKQLASETGVTGQTPTEFTGRKLHSTYPATSSPSPARTVLSHVHLTLSPNRPATSPAHPGDVLAPSGNFHSGTKGAGATAGDSVLPPTPPPPPSHPAPGASCPVAHQPASHGPPYPPLPMPVPAFYPAFPARPEPSVPTAQDGSKVNVWTQTVRPSASTPPPVATTGKTMRQEGSAQVGRSQPGLVPSTTASTTATSSHAPITRSTDVPVMLPYKPAGSSKLFYMPDCRTRNRTGGLDSESSSAADSQDAPPTRIATEVLGTGGYVPSSKLTKRRERAYRKASAHRVPRAKEEMRLLERGNRRHHSSLTTEGQPLRDAGGGSFYTGYPAELDAGSPPESRNGRRSRYPEARQWAREPSGRRTRWYATLRPADGGATDHLRPLAAGAEEEEEGGGHAGLSYKERAKAAARVPHYNHRWGQLSPGARHTHLTGGPGSPAERTGGGARYSSLDELWERFKERQTRHQSLDSSSASELSLLERLDQLAHFLRDPVQRSLLAAEGGRRRGARGHTAAAVSPDPTPADSASLEEISTERIKNILNGRRCAGSEGAGSSTLPSTESDTAPPSRTQTETGSSLSTIDTARLVRAFGPERVITLPLARLYGTIENQIESSAHKAERPRRAETRRRGAPGDRQVSGARSLVVSTTTTTSDSPSTESPPARPPRDPSNRLVNKKGTRLVNQGVQTGSLEIVPGTARRNTRDVGMTFPSPDSNGALGELRQRSVSPTGRNSSGKQAVNGAKDRRKKGSSRSERLPSKGSRSPGGPAHESTQFHLPLPRTGAASGVTGGRAEDTEHPAERERGAFRPAPGPRAQGQEGLWAGLFHFIEEENPKEGNV